MTNHIVLLQTKRSGVSDCLYYGSVFFAKNGTVSKAFGQDKSTISFMRSLAKPIQASIICDCNIINDFKLEKEEIALFCGSHSGTNKQINILKNILNKFNSSEDDLLLAPMEPLDTCEFDGKKTKLHNNCSGKHIMMLLMCKYLNLDLKNYTDVNHPIQKIIKEKQEELSKYKSSYVSYDGCSTPLWGLPYENIIIAYNNLFSDNKYKILFDSIIENFALYGGYNRLDSEIIELGNGNLFSKVGAGGFVIVHNIKTKQTLLLKMAQDNNQYRRLITLDILSQLKWITYNKEENIYNQIGQQVANYCYEIDII